MTKDKELVERRKNKRFQAKDGALAVLKPPWPNSIRLGQIIDISMGGLSFRCIAGEDRFNGSSELSVIFANHGFYLHKLPIKSISDLETARMPFGSMTPRRRSVQFEELRDDQVSQLEYFIQNHTTGDV